MSSSKSFLINLFSLFFTFSGIFSAFLSTNQAIIHTQNSPFLPISPFYFKFGAAIKPKPEKESTGGEDALLASKYIMGVSDGVGAWANQGIDPSDYSYRLMHNSDTYFHAYPNSYSKDPRKLLILSALTNSYKGSSTMVLCTLNNEDMYTANVGDSGYIILVPILKNLPNDEGTSFIYDIVYKSEPQQHGYNFPFQLGPTGDNPVKVTQARIHKMGYGAIVLTYSDGISDNLFKHEIKTIVNIYVQELKMKAGIQIRDFVPIFDPTELANRLKDRAFKKSIDTNAITPFQVDALNWGFIYPGGKSDDISIVVGMIMVNQDYIDQSKNNLEKNEEVKKTENDKKDVDVNTQKSTIIDNVN